MSGILSAMATRSPLSVDTWYHCYSRGVDKRRVFEHKADYKRFLALLYLANGTATTHYSNLRKNPFDFIFGDSAIKRGARIVELGAYCLMPNHVHFLLKGKREGGIAKYMQKIFTGYTMYFNKSRERTGALFSGTFKSKYVGDDIYFKQVFSYIHLNPVELFNTKGEKGSADLRDIERKLQNYEFSSYPAFSASDSNNVAKKIVGTEVLEMFDHLPTLAEMLRDADEYAAPPIKV